MVGTPIIKNNYVHGAPSCPSPLHSPVRTPSPTPPVRKCCLTHVLKMTLSTLATDTVYNIDILSINIQILWYPEKGVIIVFVFYGRRKTTIILHCFGYCNPFFYLD